MNSAAPNGILGFGTALKVYAPAGAADLLLASCRDISCIDSRIWG